MLTGCIGGVPNSQTVPVSGVDADGCTSITVAARSTQVIEVPITKGIKVNYTFKVDNRKLEISSVFGGEKGSVTLMEKKYVNGEDGPCSGSWTAPGDGIISVFFDNTHSMLRSKEIAYKVEPEA
jgi:hypothetical protein